MVRIAATANAVAAIVVSVVATVWLALERPATWSVDEWYFAVDVVVGVVYAAASWLILVRRPHAVGWTFALASIGGALAGIGYVYGLRAEQRPGLPAAGVISTFDSWMWVPGTLALVAVVPWLVRPGRQPVHARIGAGFGWALALFVVVLRTTDPWPWPDEPAGSLVPIHSVGWREFCEVTLPWAMAVLVLAGLAATADVVWRWRRGPQAERRGLGWLAIGSFVMAISFAPLALPSQWLGNSVAVFTFTPIAHLVAQAFLPAAAAVAILGQRMWGIDLAFSRTVVWGLLTVMLAAFYVGVVAVAGLFVGDGAAAGIAGAALAVAIGPARSWVQRRVDRLLRGSMSDAAGTVRQLGRQLGRAGSDDDLLTTLADGLRDSLALASVEVMVPEGEQGAGPAGGGGRRVLVSVGVPERAGDPDEVTLDLRSTTVGWLQIRPPRGLRLDARGQAVLATVAPVVAAAVALAGLTAEVQQARERLIAARVEERRLLRREIHDGLGPSLAGIGLGLRAYRNLRATDPERADELLDTLSREVEQRAAEVRTLARTLLPPALEEVGLEMALAELVARYDNPAMTVELRVDVRSVIPMPVAAAAYAVAAEALVNVVRHAGAAEVVIAVDDADGLNLTVDDDGAGLPGALVAGIGLRSMRERAGELGGTCDVGGGPLGGVRVQARFPLVAVSAARRVMDPVVG